MTRMRIRKAKRIRKRDSGPIEAITHSSTARSVLLKLEELLEDIDQAIDETCGWPG